jgi:hypothetical protein
MRTERGNNYRSPHLTLCERRFFEGILPIHSQVRRMSTFMKWIFAAILAFFLGLFVVCYLYGVSLRNAGIIMARNSLKQAKKDYDKHGYVTNDGSSGYQVWLSSNIVTIGSTQYQCFITVRDAKFYDEGVLAMTTNQVLIWLDAKRKPKIIDDSYRPPIFPPRF